MQTQATLVGDKRSHYSATLAFLGDMEMVMYTLITDAIYRGSEERSESPLVESVENLTSMLSQLTEIEPRR